MSSKNSIVFAILFTVLLSFGCSGRPKIDGLVVAEGQVLYDDKPLPWANVIVAPKVSGGESRSAMGMTDANGKFKLRTLGRDGALPGEYTVTVSKYVPDEGPQTLANWKKRRESDEKEPTYVEPKETDPPFVSVLPEKFAKAAQSGIEITIGPKGDRTLKIELKD